MALQQFNATVQYVPRLGNDKNEPPGRYAVTLPWRPGKAELPNNFGLTIGRLRSALRRLRKDEHLMEEYDKTMKEQIESGILERVHRPLQADGPRVYYIPHQPVFKSNSSTTKMRIVFDVSSGRPSLNSLLFRGKVYAGKDDKAIAAILLRARFMPNLICMDLARAFLQVILQKQDRDVTRIMWPWKPLFQDEPLIYRFTRVTFGLGPAPFLLGAVVERHLANSNSPWAPKLIRGSYCDNYLVAIDHPDQISSAVREIRSLFWNAGFNCRQFLSNCRKEILELPKDWQEEKTIVSLLGVQWNTIQDEFVFELPHWDGKNQVTRRTMLAFIASVYDPCGWLSPALLPVKSLQASIWQENLGKWDDVIDSRLSSSFLKAVQSWEGVKFTFTRRLFNKIIESEACIEIHGFADACQNGMGFAIYARIQNNDQYESALIFGRSLVIPTSLKPKPTKKGLVREISIPRLELQAMKVLVKAINQIPTFLQRTISTTHLWTDSSTVVQWLKSPETRDVFVRNRISTMRDYPVSHVRTEDNPADIASRGIQPDQLSSCQLWWTGPTWLSEEESRWPVPEFEFRPGDENRETKEMEPFHSIPCMTATTDNETPEQKQNEFIEVKKFSQYWRIRRIIAYVLRFLSKCGRNHPSISNKIKLLPQQTGSHISTLTLEECDAAEFALIKHSQGLFPPNEDSQLHLGIYTDELELLRCKGRFHYANVDENSKNPIYLPTEAPLTGLILKQMHVDLHHCGPSTLISEFRKRFWSSALRRLIRQYIYMNKQTKCLPCAIMQAKPFPTPAEPPLPANRVNQSRPFEHTGIDYFGPYKVKTSEGIAKAYGLIFSCLTTRAIHLELTSDMTTDRTILAIRRFIARRGSPSSILSDNARQFQLAKNVIDSTWNLVIEDDKLLNYTNSQHIRWNHTTERAPWRGSVYERLIACVKYCLRRTLSKRALEYEELLTTMVEVEKIVNSRPMTVISEGDLIRPLRPLDFLLPQGDGPTIEYKADSDLQDPDFLLTKEYNASELRKLQLAAVHRIQKFWRIWLEHYLPALREKWRRPKPFCDHPREGQIVLVYEDETPQCQWKIACIVKLLTERL